MITRDLAAPAVLALLVGTGLTACNRTPRDEAGPAPVDSPVALSGPIDSGGHAPDTSRAAPPITPAPSAGAPDTPPAAAPSPPRGGEPTTAAKRGAVSKLEYDGWRQYSVNCARCHGQDVLPNPVAANLLLSLGSKGSIDSYEKFAEVVTAGRPARGMPAFTGLLSPEQIQAIYAYVKGRAETRIPAGRPQRPEA